MWYIVVPDTPACLGEILTLLQDLENLNLAFRKSSACNHYIQYEEPCQPVTAHRYNALQLLASQCFLHFKYPPLRLTRRHNLNCSHGEKLHHALHSPWCLPLWLTVCRSVWATCVCGHQLLPQFATSRNLSCCGSTTNFSAKLPDTPALFGIWSLLHKPAVD